MSHIQSRKHAAARRPRPRSTIALAAAAFALPGAVLAQSAAAPSAAATQPRGETTLPTVRVQAAAPENELKSDVLSSPKFSQPIVDTPQTITVIKKELLLQQGATTLSEALRNTTRIGRTVEDVVVTGVNAVQTPTTGPDTTTRSRQGRHQDNEILTNQTNLASEFQTFGLKNSLSTGFELTYERQRTNTPQTQSGTASLYSPNPNDAMAMPKDIGVFTVGSTLTASAYAFETLNFSDAFLINGGARYDKFHTDTSGTSNTAANGATPVVAPTTPLGLTDGVWSYKVGAVFKPAKNGSVYATYSDSRQPPGGTNFALSSQTTSQAQPNLKPTEGSNIELGTKWDLLGGDLLATGAIYRSENKNEFVSDGAAVPTYSAVGKRRVQGVELGLVGIVTKELSVSVGYSHMDSKILKAAPASQGGVLVFSPVNTFTSWLAYKLPLGFAVGGGMRYADTSARSSNTAAPTSNLLQAPSYWVGDAMASYDITKNWQVQLNVYNLFDKNYMQSLNNGGSRYTPGAERNGLVSLNAKF